MAYVAPTTRANGYVVDASEWNKNTVDNPIALRTGELAIASQATGDIITASSSTQLGRSAITGFGLHTVCDGRLTLTTGTPVTTSDVTAATTLYFAPHAGRQIGLYDGSSAWTVVSFNQLSIAVPATTSTMYDVYVYNNSGTATLELTAWTNDTTRATALTTQDGVYVKTGATTRRYVGSFRTTGISGQTEDSMAKRYVFNYYNRVPRELRVLGSGTWTYTTNAFRQASGVATYQLDVVVGVAEQAIDVTYSAGGANSAGAIDFYISIGYDATSPATGATSLIFQPTAGLSAWGIAGLVNVPGVGRHTYVPLEKSYGVGTTTWYGSATAIQGKISAIFPM